MNKLNLNFDIFQKIILLLIQNTGLILMLFKLLGRAQPVISPNLYSLMLMNIIAWGP